MGCGDGSFIKSLILLDISAEYIGIDLSHTIIQMANQNITDKNVHLFVTDLFKLPIDANVKFDIIHADSVLHHIIGSGIRESKQLVKEIIRELFQRLTNDGSLIIEEMYYNSFLYPPITSSIIFYGLKFCNRFNINMSKIIKEFPPGLEVDFLYDKELLRFLEIYGKTRLIKKVESKIPRLYRFFLLKKLGHISIEVKSR